MTFARKIFLAMCLLLAATCIIIGVIACRIIERHKIEEYLGRYDALGYVVAKSFMSMEAMGEQISLNALATLREVVATKGLLSDDELDTMAQQLGVTAFYIQDAEGRFLRSSDLPVEQQISSLFEFCQEYRGLVNGSITVQHTPIVPGYPVDRPSKFTMVPNAAGTGILEAGYNLEFIGTTLAEVVRGDSNISSAAIFAPNGYQLGIVDKDGSIGKGLRGKPQDPWFGHRLEAGRAVFQAKIPASVQQCCECVIKGTQTNSPVDYFYTLRLEVGLANLYAEISSIRTIVIIAVAMALVATSVAAWWLSRRLVSGLKNIEQTAAQIIRCGDLTSRVKLPPGNDEVHRLARTFNSMVISLQDGQNRLIETARLRSVAKLAAEVAHDIRSPVAALDAVCAEVSELAEEERYLIREANRRIRDIANNLLNAYHPRESTDKTSTMPELLVSALLSVISEKRAQFRHGRIAFQHHFNREDYLAFVDVSLSSFKRVVSNLLNNAIEASTEPGVVSIRTWCDDACIALVIEDKGSGMPQEVIEKAMQGGYTSKSGRGSGLGLISSIERLRQWGGHLTIKSEVGVRTEISVFLPRCKAPAWFANCVQVLAHKTTLILDDDNFIGALWQQRLRAECGQYSNLAIHSFHRCADFIDYVTGQRDQVGICLLDYEYFDDCRTGIDLIEQLDIAEQSYLVTSHDEETPIRERCRASGIRMIPKSLISMIPVYT